jgi:hypothetical protein
VKRQAPPQVQDILPLQELLPTTPDFEVKFCKKKVLLYSTTIVGARRRQLRLTESCLSITLENLDKWKFPEALIATQIVP